MTWHFDCGFSFAISPNYNGVTFESYVHFHRKERKGTRGSGCRRVIRTEGCLGRPSDDRYRHVEEIRRLPDDMIESTLFGGHIQDFGYAADSQCSRLGFGTASSVQPTRVPITTTHTVKTLELLVHFSCFWSALLLRSMFSLADSRKPQL